MTEQQKEKALEFLLENSGGFGQQIGPYGLLFILIIIGLGFCLFIVAQRMIKNSNNFNGHHHECRAHRNEMTRILRKMDRKLSYIVGKKGVIDFDQEPEKD